MKIEKMAWRFILYAIGYVKKLDELEKFEKGMCHVEIKNNLYN